MIVLLLALLLLGYLVYLHVAQPDKSTDEDGVAADSNRMSAAESAAKPASAAAAAPAAVSRGNAAPKHHTILPTVPEHARELELSNVRERVSRTVESLEWVNEITRACWPHIGRILERELEPTIAPLINAALPKPLKNFTFLKGKLGKDPITVDRVTVHKRYQDSVALDLDVSFVGHPDIMMKVAPLSAPFGVKELRWAGRLTVLLRPLTPILPCIGAVQATFVSQPELSMDFVGIANIADFKPVERVVDKILRDVIASMLVLPNRILVKLNDDVDFFDVYYPPLGALQVTVKRGEGFEKEKRGGGLIKLTPDLYTKLELGGQKFETPVVKKSRTPEWNASNLFILSDIEQSLDIKIMDWDPAVDDLLGKVSITADKLLLEKEQWTGFTDEVDQVVAANAKILLSTQLFVFTQARLVGPVVVTVLVDRALHLPASTKASSCHVAIGPIERKTPMVVKPPEPVPGIDPVNPIWSSWYDIIVPEVTGADVVLTVIADKRPVGSVTFSAAEIGAIPEKAKGGVFNIGAGASIRAKIIYRGLIPEGLDVK